MRGALLYVACALAMAGCDVNPFSLGGNPSVGPDASVGDPGADGGTGTGGGLPDAAPPCTPSGPDDTCDGIDNDCDGIVDNDFDLDNDDANCGVCGNRCTSLGAIEECRDAECVFVECQPGFVDLDPDVAGCEYLCPVFPAQPEDCNGVDDDCDGVADEVVELPPPPANQCRNTPGTPCEAVSMVCDERGGITTWYCDYPDSVEFEPSVPNGIVLQETLCDGNDGDCDGVADDPFIDLGQECDNGELGICRDGGVRACDPADPSRTTCDLSMAPDPTGTATAEVCNGLDDDCDGIVDNADGPNRVVDDMVRIDRGGLDFFIYRYEASRPDAGRAGQGVSRARSCSAVGRLPWAGATFATAAAACAAAGKRLCTAAEFAAACGGAAGTTYPYGDDFDAGACNAEPFDGVPGGADDDVLLPGGDALACLSGDGIADLSGNLKEWTDDIRGTTGGANPVDIAVLRGGGYDTPARGATCAFDASRLPVNASVSTVGFRCCSDTAP